MYFVSHICIPVTLGIFSNIISKVRGGSAKFHPRSLLIIGLAGILPDLVNPHIYLVDRFNSWSHTIWFLLGVIVLVMAAHLFKWINNLHLVIAIPIAVLLHIFCDGITGGVKLLYPVDMIFGKYYIGSNHWIQLDLICITLVLLTFIIFRVTRQRNYTMS